MTGARELYSHQQQSFSSPSSISSPSGLSSPFQQQQASNDTLSRMHASHRPHSEQVQPTVFRRLRHKLKESTIRHPAHVPATVTTSGKLPVH